MKTLGNLKPNKGSHHKRKRLGRGIGSGLGKTAGKGHKGQLARKGGKVRPGFEGGQTPLYRRIPKRGFTPLNRTRYNIINLDQLSRVGSSERIDRDALKIAGLAPIEAWPVKLLARGKLDKKVTIVVNKASAAAIKLVESAGGKVEILAN